MKKILKRTGYLFMICVVLSYCIPKGGPIWIHKRLKYIKENISKNTYEIAVDFSKPSCEDRLFIYELDYDADLVYSGVVLHGQGGKSTPSKPEFSNEIGSNCSSLGVFTLEGLVRMKNGMEAIKLKGWSDTNSNAEVRGIYIHPCIMATLLPFNLPKVNFPLNNSSNGCFAVSYHTFEAIKYYMLNDSDKTKLIAYYEE